MPDLRFCSLPSDALSTRIGAWRDLEPVLLSRRRTPTGAELRYRLEPGVAERLLDLVRAEAGCCPDLNLGLTVTLTVDAPDDMRDRVAQLLAPG